MLLLASLEQFDIRLVDFLVALATVGMVLFIALGSLCAPLVGSLTELVYTANRKAFYDKCAMQISQSALVNAVFIILALSGGALLLVYQNHPELLAPPLLWRPALFLSPLFAALFLWLLYVGAWSLLKKLRFLHVPLGLAGALIFLAVLFAAFLLLANMQQPEPVPLAWDDPLATLRALQGLLPGFLQTPVMWAMLGFLFCTGVAAGLGTAQLWLILRRNRADYGRDYYVFAMHYCARIALAFTVFATALAGGVYWLLRQATPAELSQPHDPGILLTAAGLPLCCCLLWLVIGTSETPLRHKPGAFFACLFLYVALCAQILMLMTTFPLE